MSERFDECLETFVTRIDEHRQIDPIVFDRIETGIVNGRRHRVTHRRRDDAVHFCRRADGVPAVEPFHVVDRDLAGSGLLIGREGGECEERAEFFGQHAAEQAGFAHAEGDRRTLPRLQNFERFEIVPNRAGGPDDFVYRGRAGIHLRENVIEPIRPAGEIVTAENQFFRESII